MRRIFLFMMVSLDGYFEGPNHDLSWHSTDQEFNEFAIENLKSIDTILFGRTTYEMMAEYWPSPAGRADDPIVADLMTSTQKYVFSHALKSADWQNTTLADDLVGTVTRLKEESGKEIAVFGSSKLCVSLIEAGLLDGAKLMINPVVLGAGTTLFSGIKEKLDLDLQTTRRFGNGNMLLNYQVKQKGG